MGGSRLSSTISAAVPMTVAEKMPDQVVYKENPLMSSQSKSQVIVAAQGPTQHEEIVQTAYGSVRETETREVLNPIVTPAQYAGPAVVHEEKLPPTISTRAYEVFRRDASSLFPGAKILSVGRVGPVTTPTGCVYDPNNNTITSVFTGEVTQVIKAHHIGSTLGKMDMPTTMGGGGNPVVFSQSPGDGMMGYGGTAAPPYTTSSYPPSYSQSQASYSSMPQSAYMPAQPYMSMQPQSTMYSQTYTSQPYVSSGVVGYNPSVSSSMPGGSISAGMDMPHTSYTSSGSFAYNPSSSYPRPYTTTTTYSTNEGVAYPTDQGYQRSVSRDFVTPSHPQGSSSGHQQKVTFSSTTPMTQYAETPASFYASNK